MKENQFSYSTVYVDVNNEPVHRVHVKLKLPEDFYTKDQVVVWPRPELTQGANHMTQPFHSTSDVIYALTN